MKSQLRLSLLLFFAAQFACADEQRWLTPGATALKTNGQITAFSLNGISSGPTTVTIVADGTVWFTLGAGNAIGRMRSDGSDVQVFLLPHPDSSPRIIAKGSDGNLWFTEHTGNRIGRITPDGVITEFDIATPNSQPRAIALGADGNLWFGMFAAGKVGRVTPQGVITEFELPTSKSGPRALAAGPDGNIWFSEFYVGKIGRITPAGKITEYPLPRANAGPADITAGADGAMWFVELTGTMDGFSPDGNRVGRITLTGHVAELPIPDDQSSAINIAVGPDRSIWFTKGAALWQVSADGLMVSYPVSGPARTVGLSAGSDRQPPQQLINRLWFTDPGGNRVGFLSFD